jgi:SAM-dependent methyltransferase
MSMDRFWSFFYEIYESLPRQGPGDPASTERALGLLPRLTRHHRILDVGCGTGTQTLDLARATPARIVAVDNHAPFVAQLARRVADLDLGDRVEAQVGDMNDLRFADGSFDVVWSEGAIFIIGFARGLSAWRRLLVPGGHLVVSELCWLRDDPPAEMCEFLEEECAGVGDVAARREVIATNGYTLVGDFVLPARGWWDNYYVPLASCLARFRDVHADDPEALAVADRSRREIDLFLRHGDTFGYVFFVMRRDAPR